MNEYSQNNLYLMLILLFATDLQLVNVVSEADDATVGILLGIPIGPTAHPLTDTAAHNPMQDLVDYNSSE